MIIVKYPMTGISLVPLRPEQVENFIAIPSDEEISLSWSIPTDSEMPYSGIRIVRKVGDIPTTVTDGDIIELGSTEVEYTDYDLDNGTLYYYRVFPYGDNGVYQTDKTAIAGAVPYPINFVYVYTNTQTEYSDINNIIELDMDINIEYARLYDNGIILNETQYQLPESQYSTQGYISEFISNEDGYFDEDVVIGLTYTRYDLSNGVQITFADDSNFASEITFNVYSDDTLLGTETIANSSSVYTYITSDYAEYNDNKIEIVFNKTNFPYRDIRINNIYLEPID